MIGTQHRQDRPWDNTWPVDGLEKIAKCPICGSQEREVLHEDLVDNVFYAAPGKWSLWKCAGCGAAYSDPRPDQRTIHLAYSSYYTHIAAAEKTPYELLSPIRKLRRRMTNGYTNWRYSTREAPASALGIFLLLLLWPLRQKLASEYRHLPRCPNSGGSLLDVGCGGGAFLRVAKSAGWRVTGVDPDPKAVMNCRAQGFEVLQGGLDQFASGESFFDVITLNHVIEHVPDPVAALQACHRLLKPGGQLWLATPNMGSLGHRKYGRNWRGLEPPRHLVLFNQQSLENALARAGFGVVAHKTGSNPLRSMTIASEAIRRGIPLDEKLSLSSTQNWSVITGRLRQTLSPKIREFLTVTAYKDDSSGSAPP